MPMPLPIVKSVELTEWATDNSSRYDVALIGAFIYAMKQQRKFAATVAYFDAAFQDFSNEVA
jgi:hypothetical protein